jgi:hypothetical protein
MYACRKKHGRNNDDEVLHHEMRYFMRVYARREAAEDVADNFLYLASAKSPYT